MDDFPKFSHILLSMLIVTDTFQALASKYVRIMGKRRGFIKKPNKIPLNLLSTRRNSYRSRHKIERVVLTVSVPDADAAPNNPDVCVSSPWEDSATNHEDNGTTFTDSVTAHIKRKMSLATRWEALRSSAYDAMVQNQALLLNQQCFSCGSDNADVRCEQCGPAVHMCYDCCSKYHGQCNYHHCPEMWQICCSSCASTNSYFIKIL